MLLAHTHYFLQKNGVTKEEYDIESMDRRVKERYKLKFEVLESKLYKYFLDMCKDDHVFWTQNYREFNFLKIEVDQSRNFSHPKLSSKS